MPFDTTLQGITALQQQMRQSCQSEKDFLYLPLLGKRFSSSEAATEDLAASMNEFISDTNPKRVCALLGDGGSGKSSFLKQFTLKLSNEYESGKPIPLFVSLPLLTDPIHSVIEETLTKIGFDEAQIVELKTNHSFIFILDGYDEIHQLQNLYVSNRLNEWNAKTIISCRSQYLYNKENANLYFMPLENEREQPQLLQTLYVAPFDQDQIRQYLESYSNSNIAVSRYEEIITIPGLQDLITTPFLLKLAVEALPEILARYAVSSSTPQERQQLTQTDLYKSFIRRWFERQEQKLKDSGHISEDMLDQKPIFWRYCQSLALEMHRHNLSWLNAEDERFAVYFENDAETEMLRSACPIKMTEDKIGFWHGSLGMHFVAQTIYQEALAEENTHTQQQNEIIEDIVQERPQGDMHLRLETDNPTFLYNLADEVNKDHRYKAWLFNIIERSKTNKHYAVGAANAISVLNAARVSFSGMNFTNVKIPYSNLNDGIFDGTRFDGANLSNVKLQRTWIRNTNFENANMSNVDFGEKAARKLPNVVQRCIYSPDGSYLAVTSGSGIFIYNTETRNCDHFVHFGHQLEVTSCAFTFDSRFLISGSLDETIIVTSIPETRKIAMFADHQDPVKSIACAPNRLYFASGGGHLLKDEGDSDIRLWDLKTGRVIRKLIGHRYLVCGLAFSSDGEWLASVSQDNSIKIWLVENGTLIKNIDDADGHELRSVAFIPNQKMFVTVGDDTFVKIWSVEENSPIKTLAGHTKQIFALAISSDGKLIATAGNDKTIRIWSIEANCLVTILEGHQCLINCVAFSPNAQELVSVSGVHKQFVEVSDNSLRFWDATKVGDSKKKTFGHTNKVRSIAFSSDNKLIVSGSLDGTLALWNAETGENVKLFQGHTDWVRAVAYSSDGLYLASGGGNTMAMLGAAGGGSTIRLWSTATQQVIHSVEAHKYITQSLAFSPDSQLLASAGDVVVKLWSIPSCTLIQEYSGHTNMVSSVKFSVDGSLLISAGNCPFIMVWDVRTHNLIKNFRNKSYTRNTSQINCIALSADNKILASASEDGYVRTYDFSTEEESVIGQQEKACYWVVFSPNNIFLAAGGQDGNLYIWEIPSNRRLASIFLNSTINSIAWKMTASNLFLTTAHDDKSVRFYALDLSSQFLLKLLWATYQSTLTAVRANIKHAKGLSSENIELLTQLGSIGKPVITAGNSEHFTSDSALNIVPEEVILMSPFAMYMLMGNVGAAIAALKQEAFFSGLPTEVSSNPSSTRSFRSIQDYIKHTNQSAFKALELKNYPEAIRLFKLLISGSPETAGNYCNCACAYHLLGLENKNSEYFREADAHFKKAKELNSTSVSILVEYANFLRERKQYQKSLNILDQAIAIKDNSEEENNGLSYGRGELSVLPEELETLLDSEERLTFHHPEVFAYYLKIYCLCMQRSEALQEVLDAFQVLVNSLSNSDCSELYNKLLNLSCARYETRNNDVNLSSENESIREKILALSTTYLNTKGKIFHKAGRRQVEEMKQRIELNPFLTDEELNHIVVHAVSDGKKRRDHFQAVLNSSLAQQGIFAHTAFEATANIDNAHAATQKTENKNCVIS